MNFRDRRGRRSFRGAAAFRDDYNANLQADPAEVLAEINAQADEAVAELRHAYAVGAVKVAVNPDDAMRYASAVATSGISLLFTDPNYAQDAVKANYARLGQYIAKWSTADLDRVRGGEKPWSWWADYGQTLADSTKFYTDMAWDSSTILASLAALKQTAVDVDAKIVQPLLRPASWLLVAGGLAAVVYGPALLGLIPRRKS